MDLNLKDVLQQISNHVDPEIIDEVNKVYSQLDEAYLLKDHLKTGILAGHFCELIIAALQNCHSKSKIDLNKINFDKSYNYLINLPKCTPEDELLYLNIPLVARSIYSIRNKKRIAHIKSFDPNCFDIDFIHDSCKWIFSQLILIFSDLDEKNLRMLIENVIQKKVPFIEEFEDGSLLVLAKNVDFKDELLLILYSSPKRLTNADLRKIVLPRYNSKITTYLHRLKEKKLVHINKDGSKITRLGIKYIESDVFKKCEFAI